MHPRQPEAMRVRMRWLVATAVSIAVVMAVLVLPPAARASNGVLNPPHTDAGLDTDVPPNGLYDYLVISVGVSVTTAGGFFLFVSIYDNTGTTFITQGQTIVNLGTGSNVVDVRIVGYEIWRSGFDGPYQAQIVLLNNSFAFLGFNPYTTGVYLATSFEPVPARFAPPHSDVGVDTDTDTRFDYLAVDAMVNAAKAGMYTVSGSLYDSPPTTFIASATNTTSLPAGTGPVRLRFSSTDIRVAGLNGPYDIDLTLTSATGQQLDTGIHTTGTYFLSDFDGLGASFTPPHEDFVVDLDQDGFNDYLVVNTFVTAVQAGVYNVQADIPSIPLTVSTSAYLPAGTQVVQLNFLGWDIFNAGIDGPYTVDLTLRDDASRTIDVDTHTTGTYFAIDFEPSPPARWIAPFSAAGRDDQGNALFDFLMVNATVDADRHGDYSWSINLWDSTFTAFVTSAFGTFQLSSGSNPVTMLIPGLRIQQSAVNGPYGVDMYLSDSVGRQVDVASFTTGPFLAADFDGVPGRLTPPYFDIGVDRSVPPDGILDVIAVDVPVTVTTAATFALQGILLDSQFFFLSQVQRIVDLSPGLTTVRLNFSAADAFRTGQDGAFFGVLGLSAIQGGDFVNIGNDQFITRNYSAGAFDQGPSVRLSGHVMSSVSNTPLEGIGVTIWSSETRLQRQVTTDVSGYYESWLPLGDYYVFADGNSVNALGVTQSITADTVLDLSLDPPAANSLAGDVTFSGWNNATLRGDFTFGEDAAFLRFQLDVGFGNGDGTLSQSELDRILSLGARPELPLSTRDTFAVDGITYNRVNGSETFTISGAGPIVSATPINARITGDYTAAPSAVPSNPVHITQFLAEYDRTAQAQAFTLGWPANFAMTSSDPVPGVTVTGFGGPTAGVNPAADPNPRDFVTENWVNLTVETTDTTPPLVTNTRVGGTASLRTQSGPTYIVTANATDAGRGDWPIAGANYTQGAGNWAMAVVMSAQDGTFDEVTEDVTGSLSTVGFSEGSHSICVYARDSVPNNDTTGNCATVFADNTAPAVSNVRVAGQTATTVVVGTMVSVTASVSDASSGNGNIAGANVTRTAANWTSSAPMTATDGAFNSPTEAVNTSVDTTGWTAGTYAMCVYGWDDLSNGNPAATNCAQLTVITQDTTAPSVTSPQAAPNPANVSEMVNISAIVTDNIGVDTVRIQIVDGSGQTVANLTATYNAANGRYYAVQGFTSAGTYTYHIWARDAAGNWGTASGTFVVSAPPSGGPPAAFPWWILVVVIAAVAAVVLFLWFWRKRKATPAAPLGPPATGMSTSPQSPPSSPPPGWSPARPERDDLDDMLGPSPRP